MLNFSKNTKTSKKLKTKEDISNFSTLYELQNKAYSDKFSEDIKKHKKSGQKKLVEKIKINSYILMNLYCFSVGFFMI